MGGRCKQNFGTWMDSHPSGWMRGPDERSWLLSMNSSQSSTVKRKTHVAPNTTHVVSSREDPKFGSLELNACEGSSWYC